LLKVKTDKGFWEGDLVLLAVGVRPDARLAKSIGLNIGKTGAIAVNFAQQPLWKCGMRRGIAAIVSQSQPQLGKYPLGELPNKQGRVVGRNIGGKPGPLTE